MLEDWRMKLRKLQIANRLEIDIRQICNLQFAICNLQFWLMCVSVLLFPTLAFAAEPKKLTNDGDFKQHLSWSPDGKKFLFTRIHAGKMGLWTMHADGSELKKLIAADDAPNFDGSWSPDSK